MTPEQKAALDRWRQQDSYWSSDIDDNRQWFDYEQYNQDRSVLLSLVLAEHQADDDVPSDDEWLRSVIGPDRTTRLGGGFSVTFYATHAPTFSYYNGGIGGWYHDSSDIDLPKASTRGDVRRLCRALGIELKE